MSHGDGTVLRLSDVTRELREHAKACALTGCERCELWRLYTRGTKSELEAFIARFETYEWTFPNAVVLDQARAIRSKWGEGDWTAGDIA